MKQVGVRATQDEAANARRADRLRGWKTCEECGIEYHRQDPPHRCATAKSKTLTR